MLLPVRNDSTGPGFLIVFRTISKNMYNQALAMEFCAESYKRCSNLQIPVKAWPG